MAQTSVERTVIAGAEPRPAWLGKLDHALSRVPSADRLTIAALLLVVAVVSIPLLRTHALRQNELDALRSLAVLALPLHAGDAATPRTVGQLLEHRPDILRRLTDAELLDEGRLLRRHGYLFDIAAPLAGTFEGGAPVLRAWPWSHGRTGLGAFVLVTPGEVLAHPNRESNWSGLAAPPRPLPGRLEGWRKLTLGPDA